MLGHVAQSVGGALPGVGGVAGFVSQVLYQGGGDSTLTSPAIPTWGFLEALGTAGYAVSSQSARAGGAAGNDAIVSIPASTAIGISIALNNRTTVTKAATTISVAGSVVVSAASSSATSDVGGAGASGKYPGQAGSSNTSPGGKGGGRLAGQASIAANPTSTSPSAPPGLGCGGAGWRSDSVPIYGGNGAVCITLFDSYDAALAFARAAYGGTWNP